ncbi:MAG: cupin domain-containing protein [Candidatus Dadabacteria bacterium]|nr:cupin domain-containing protein [Candidatus Dadabacteria bacterium]
MTTQQSSGGSTNVIKRVDKPWGYELWWAITDRYVGKIIHLLSGHSMSYQYHEKKDETMYLLTGKVLVELDTEDDAHTKITLLPGDALRIPPLTKHRMSAVEDSEIIEVSSPEIDDIIRLEDKYGRV